MHVCCRMLEGVSIDRLSPAQPVGPFRTLLSALGLSPQVWDGRPPGSPPGSTTRSTVRGTREAWPLDTHSVQQFSPGAHQRAPSGQLRVSRPGHLPGAPNELPGGLPCFMWVPQPWGVVTTHWSPGRPPGSATRMMRPVTPTRMSASRIDYPDTVWHPFSAPVLLCKGHPPFPAPCHAAPGRPPGRATRIRPLANP
jgi:hypothetical protein